MTKAQLMESFEMVADRTEATARARRRRTPPPRPPEGVPPVGSVAELFLAWLVMPGLEIVHPAPVRPASRPRRASTRPTHPNHP